MKNPLFYIVILFASLAITFTHAKDKKVISLAELAGTWSGHRLAGGMDKPNDGPQLTVTISGNKVNSNKAGGGDISLDASTAPYHLNGIKSGGKKVYEGIVTVKDGMLIWCVGDPGKPRPTSFETKSGQWCMVLKKE